MKVRIKKYIKTRSGKDTMLFREIEIGFAPFNGLNINDAWVKFLLESPVK